MSILIAFVCFVLNTSNFYTLQFQDIDGNARSMSQYQGKKILLVNIATGSSNVQQLAGLQQLHQQYGDSVVVIGFPSNSFGYETRSNTEIKQFCQNNYGVTFLLAAKSEVKGAQINPVYQWLTNISDNGISSAPVQKNFQKFLISGTGALIGFFSPTVEPMSTQITAALGN